jgi:hypothetical protein
MNRPLPPIGPLRLLRALLRVPQPQPALPLELSAVYQPTELDDRQLQRYRAAFGFTSHGLPISYTAMLCQRAELDLMLNRRFPFRIAGAVHAEQRIERCGGVDQGRPLSITCRLQQLPPTAAGQVSVTFNSELTQDGRAVGRTFSRLVVRRGAPQPATTAAAPERNAAVIADWQTSLRDSLAYARLSGDWNPIHLHPLTARLFGLRRPIVHGMATLARTAAALEHHHGQPLQRISARFRRPLPIGAAAALGLATEHGRYAVVSDGTHCVNGDYAIDPAAS